MKNRLLLILLFLTQNDFGQTVLEALEGGAVNTCFSSSVIISKTPCNTVAGATLNDDPTTTMGTEYNWTGATGFIDGGTVRAIVDINGQCWFRRNAINIPSNYSISTIQSGYIDTGWSGFYVNSYVADRGRLYQWKAVMNYVLPFSSGTSSINDYLALERARGICPVGWHVPSDCEWQIMANYLQMPSQYLDKEMSWNTRTFPTTINTGSATFLSTQIPTAPNNQTGFSALIFGCLDANGGWGSPQLSGFWTSTLHSYNTIHNLSGFFSRELLNAYVGIQRYGMSPSTGYALRCLKD